MENSTPVNYKSIYCDLLAKKYPEKLAEFQQILNKDSLNELDILKMSKRISDSSANGKHKSYNKSTILIILDYQKSNKLNNSELSRRFDISRNTIAKWKKLFQI